MLLGGGLLERVLHLLLAGAIIVVAAIAVATVAVAVSVAGTAAEEGSTERSATVAGVVIGGSDVGALAVAVVAEVAAVVATIAGLGLSISRPLAVVVSVGVMSVAVVRNISLGGRVKALGDWVQTCKKITIIKLQFC